MNDLATELIAWLTIYTYPVVALTVLVGAIGVPLPSAMVVLAAGSISTDDGPDFWLLFAVILTAAVVGDVTSYSLGRWAGHIVVDRFGSKVGLTRERIDTAEQRFARWGGVAVLVTRCLLTGLALPINLAAGAGTYPMMRFLGFAVVGEVIWTGQFLTLGWLFGPSWVSLLEYLEDAVTVLTALAVTVALVWLLVWLLRTKPAEAV